MEQLMVAEISALDLEIVPECGGYSLYDLRLPKGQQMLGNVKGVSDMWPMIFSVCRLERRKLSSSCQSERTNT